MVLQKVLKSKKQGALSGGRANVVPRSSNDVNQTDRTKVLIVS